MSNQAKELASLPTEILEKIFQYIVLENGDCMFMILSLVCKHFHAIVQKKSFRRSVHFKWLRSVYDWSTAGAEFQQQYYVMYNIMKCIKCKIKYKEMLGFQGNGIFKKSDQFYSEISTPGYCNDCAFMQEDFTMSEEHTTLG